MICTDIAARGIDIQDLSWILNYDLPSVAVYYLHRSGRVGRGKNSTGVVYNLVTPRDHASIKLINESIKNQTALKLKSISLVSENKKNKKSDKKGKNFKSDRSFKKSRRFKRRRDDK